MASLLLIDPGMIALLLWTDGKDNDGDGLVDKADNLKTTKEVPPKPERRLGEFLKKSLYTGDL